MKRAAVRYTHRLFYLPTTRTLTNRRCRIYFSFKWKTNLFVRWCLFLASWLDHLALSLTHPSIPSIYIYYICFFLRSFLFRKCCFSSCTSRPPKATNFKSQNINGQCRQFIRHNYLSCEANGQAGRRSNQYLLMHQMHFWIESTLHPNHHHKTLSLSKWWILLRFIITAPVNCKWHLDLSNRSPYF